VSQYAGARQGIFTSFWTIMLILIVGGGRRTRRRDERASAREEKKEQISIQVHYRAKKICGFIRNNCCDKRNYAWICSEIDISISTIV